MLGVFVGRSAGDRRGIFELADGRHVEADGAVGFDAAEAPRPGEKAFLVVDADRQVLGWEPYPAGRRNP